MEFRIPGAICVLINAVLIKIVKGRCDNVTRERKNKKQNRSK